MILLVAVNIIAVLSRFVHALRAYVDLLGSLYGSRLHSGTRILNPGPARRFCRLCGSLPSATAVGLDPARPPKSEHCRITETLGIDPTRRGDRVVAQHAAQTISLQHAPNDVASYNPRYVSCTLGADLCMAVNDLPSSTSSRGSS